ncbi:MAG: translation initiation factor [Synergistaceae bacterium]|jgi:translation initiation factor IF-2|nr:MAG: Translation initiation factor IF-2 [Synergistales bacterium 54_24]MDI3499206.1 translation initiation factor [Synergistaceae bacterium]MDI3531681.1 translation initiation factor [Synergistaceae bacterium]
MLGLSNKELVNFLRELGVDVKTHMSSIDTDTAQLVEEAFRGERTPSAKDAVEEAAEVEEVIVPENATVGEVAERLNMPVADVVKALVQKGLMVPADSPVDEKVLKALSEAYGKEFLLSREKYEEKAPVKAKPKPKGENLKPRPPVVTVMGHVDHGKTTLLDYIRHTNVTAREAGGITQHIGASVVEHQGQKIVFLDTPGHEAFTAMRARGTQVTDIVVLVVAADDGVMPQTVEAINHANAAGVPIIVAVNKVDKPNARPEVIRRQLADLGLIPEEWGGDTVMVDISAKTGQGVDHLLEMILLVAELAELKADPTVNAEGAVIEARLDKGKGPVATVIVQQGTLRQGDIVLFDSTWGRIRAMQDDKGKSVKEATPSMPVEITGLNDVPQAGELFRKIESEKEARDAIERKKIEREVEAEHPRRLTLEEFYERIEMGEKQQLNIVLKCDVRGSLEALKASLLNLATEEVGISIVHEGVGNISESDIMLASASNAVILGFDVKLSSDVKKIAEREGVQVRLYRVIYDLIDDVRAALEGMLAPTLKENVTGHAEVRAVFSVPNLGSVAGCYVLDGTIRRSAKVRILRSGAAVWEGAISSLRRFKDDVREVSAGYECGIGFADYHDFREGDIIEAFEVVEEKRRLEDAKR